MHTLISGSLDVSAFMMHTQKGTGVMHNA